ncbi:MAG: hypothetical protein CM15mP1_4020 [Methanobacteriota archaeon]|nr:MAG: hypothetical protein CM15mP1_4020 [Euryarchaeota archaeon]
MARVRLCRYGRYCVEELEFQGYPTFLGPAGIFAGKIIANQNLIEHFPIDAATEIGDRHMYVVHGNQDKRSVFITEKNV